MRKSIRMMGITLALILIITSFAGTAAFAEETIPTTISFTDGFETVSTIEKNSVKSYEVQINKPEVTLAAQSSDEGIIRLNFQEEEGNPGYYIITLAACEDGEATVTFTASDGTSLSQTLTVEGTGEDRNYTISSDTTDDFSIPKGSSKIIKIHYVSEGLDLSYPVLVTDDQETSLQTKLIDYDYENNDYYYRVDAVGNEGQTGLLYMGGSEYIPQKLCTVTIKANNNLRLDTTSTYMLNTDESYRFVAYTTSPTPPQVSSYNDLISVEYLGKVTGGYEYRMNGLEQGESLVQVTLGGEIASFPVVINYFDAPSVKSDTPQKITLAKGASYTYKFTIMGGGEPNFVASTNGVVSTQLVKKDGIDYYCKVTAIGEPTTSTDLYVTFPDVNYDDFNVNVSNITVSQPVGVVMKSDTNEDISIKQGSSYTFKITGATSFYPGSAGAFKTELISKDGNDTLYKVTATGQPGQQTGFYMAVAGQPAQKVCVVSVIPSQTVTMKSDTNNNFSLKQGTSYTFKITGATSFNPGSAGVFKTELIRKEGNDTHYKITAIGQPGQQSGFFMSAVGQPTQKVCVVTVVAAQPATPITFMSDTNSNFSLKKGNSYQYKITAPGASSISFTTGSSGVFNISPISHIGDYFYYKITAVGQSGQQTGIYVSVPGQAAKKINVVSIT